MFYDLVKDGDLEKMRNHFDSNYINFAEYDIQNDGNDYFLDMIYKGNSDVMEIFLERGYSTYKIIDNNYETYMHVVAEDGTRDMAFLMIEYNVDLYDKTINRKTPLNFANYNTVDVIRNNMIYWNGGNQKIDISSPDDLIETILMYPDIIGDTYILSDEMYCILNDRPTSDLLYILESEPYLKNEIESILMRRKYFNVKIFPSLFRIVFNSHGDTFSYELKTKIIKLILEKQNLLSEEFLIDILYTVFDYDKSTNDMKKCVEISNHTKEYDLVIHNVKKSIIDIFLKRRIQIPSPIVTDVMLYMDFNEEYKNKIIYENYPRLRHMIRHVYNDIPSCVNITMIPKELLFNILKYY